MPDNYKKLVDKIKKYDPNFNFEMLEKAYQMSKAAHEGQMRESGEPFIVHPVEVALILADFEFDCTSIVAGLLHDTIEDTTCTLEELRKNFGDEIANIVDGVTKLGKIPYSTKEEQQVENLRKMFLAMAKDIRVILIKLADRLHNMRTLGYMSPEKQKEKARETLEIYAPLAHRLGIFKIKWELEDLCLKYIDPEEYENLVDKIAKKRQERENYIKEIIDKLKNKVKEIGLENTKVEGRAKHFYSIYKKMKEQGKTLEQIYDLFAVRIIVDNVKDCYTVLGLVHEMYRPMPGRFKDYIAVPKPNMYQSLHSTVIGAEGIPFEIQIRTWAMHKTAEVGIAAHWKYKEGTEGDEDFDKKLGWLRQLVEWQKDVRDSKEYMETLKIDLFSDEVFVFTPKGDVISLPAGSVTIDFAYAIHSAVGNKMIGAKVNGKIVNLDYVLKNGDIVEVLTSNSGNGPSRDWLKLVKSGQAKNKIKQWFKKEKREENIIRGKEIFEKEVKKHGYTANQLLKQDLVDIILKKYNFVSLEDLYSAIGYGAITANRVVSRLKEEYNKTLKPEELARINEILKKKYEKKTKLSGGSCIHVKGIDNCLVRLSRCCNPVPGDEIVGYITRGRGVSVHRKDCCNINLTGEESQRLVDVSWYDEGNSSFKADIIVKSYDRDLLLYEVTNVLAEFKVPIKAVNARTTKGGITIISLTVEILNIRQLENLIMKLKKINGVFEVSRNKV